MAAAGRDRARVASLRHADCLIGRFMLLPAFPPLSMRVAAAHGVVLPAGALLFARARFALFEGLRLLAAERAIRRVWLPGYICAPVLEAVEALKLRAQFYDIDEHLAPRLHTVVPERGDALLMVHYFGLAQPMEPLGTFCRAHGLALVEDCAHSVPVTIGAGRVGSQGEVAVFSLRKQAPVPSGGLLVLNDARLRDRVATPRHGLGDARALLKLGLMALERIAVDLGWNVLALKDRLPVLDASDEPHRAGARLAAYETPPAPSALLPAMLRRVPWQALIAHREDGYRRLGDRLGSVPGVVVPVPDPPAGSVPQSFPIRVAAPEVAVRLLRRRGVEAMRWPGREQIPLPDGAFPGTRAWIEGAVCLPLGAPLTPSRLDRLAAVVAAAVRESSELRARRSGALSG
jgi:dTDP-4-amino-4,6-dideoxygalactose transaminase